MSKDKKRLVPVRRFKEFENSDAWEQRKLGEITKTHSFKQYISEAFDHGKYMVIQQGENPIAGYANGDPFENFKDVTLFGDHTLSLFKPQEKFFVASDGIKILSPSLKMNGMFYYYLLEKYRPQSEGYKRHFTIMKKSTALFPIEIDEQIKISNFLKELDSLIALHQRKLDKLKRVKSAYLTELFPAEGEREPKRRFPGFTGAWEQRKLGEVVKRETCQVISSDNNPSVEYDDVVSEQGELNKDVLAKHSVKKGIQFNKNHILYGKLRPYLHNWLNPNFKGVAVGDWWVLKPKNDIKKSFLYALIQTQRYDNVANISTGSKMPRADWNLVSNTNFAIPSQLDEQLKIGEVFSQLDSLIALHQRKLDKLKKMKAAYLNEMFV